MLKKAKQDVRERYKRTRETAMIQQLRDQCYIFALSYASDIAKIYQSGRIENTHLKHLNNRELDLWEPLVAILCVIDYEDNFWGLISPLLKLSKQSLEDKAAENMDDDDTSKIILGLKALLESDITYEQVTEKEKRLRVYRAPDVAEFMNQKFNWRDMYLDQSALSKRLTLFRLNK
jgi:hypothetical protein